MITLFYSYFPIFVFIFFLIIFLKLGFDFNFSKSKTNLLIILWILIWTFEYWFLGKFSFIRFYDEADLALSRLLYDTNHHIGGSYLHGIQGGTDYYAAHIFGGQYFSLERLLFTIFPIWIALLIHKILVVGFSMVGTYLLVRKTTAISRFHAYCFGTFVSFFHPYVVISTIDNGLGFALLPMCIYVYCYLSTKHYYLLLTTLFSLLIASSISVTHSFLVILFGILFFPIIIKIHNYKKFLFSLTVLVVVVAINWSEVLYGFANWGQDTSRVLTNSFVKNINTIIFGSFDYVLGKTDVALCLSMNCDKFVKYYPAFMLIGYVFILGIIYKKENFLRFLFIFSLIFFSPAIIYLVSSIPYLNFIQAVNFHRISYIVIIPTVLLAGHLIKKHDKRLTKIIPILFLCSSLLFLTLYKIQAVSSLFWGNQMRLSSIPNLANKEAWEPNKMYRGVTTMPHVHFHPNFLWAYGIDTLDGYTALVPKTVSDFWHYGLHKNNFILNEEPITGGNLYINYTEDTPQNRILEFNSREIDFKNSIDINMLRITNTGYIFSFFPIISKGLTLASSPVKQPYRKSDMPMNQKDFNYYKNKFFKIGKLIFDPPDIYIYEIEEFSDRFFFPNKIFYLNPESNIRDGFKYISDNYKKNSIYTSKKNISPAVGEIIYGKKIKGGYEVKIDVAQEGIFVFNTYFSPYWNVYINNQISEIYNFFNIHTGVILNKGVYVLKLKYERELLREKFINLLS